MNERDEVIKKARVKSNSIFFNVWHKKKHVKKERTKKKYKNYNDGQKVEEKM